MWRPHRLPSSEWVVGGPSFLPRASELCLKNQNEGNMGRRGRHRNVSSHSHFTFIATSQRSLILIKIKYIIKS